MAPSKSRSTPLRVVWPPTPKPPRSARKKASKPSATQSPSQRSAADGSTKTSTPIPRLPAGLPPLTDSQIRECTSIGTLDARIAALEAFEIELGLLCFDIEHELTACRKQIRQLRAAKGRPPSKPRPPR
jgi:hypothetical protein